MPRVSLDLSPGTFSTLETLCCERHQKKAEFLRELLDDHVRSHPISTEDHFFPASRGKERR